MVTKAHRGFIHIPRRGRNSIFNDSRKRKPRRPTVDPKRPRRPTVNQQITAKAAPEFGTKEYKTQLDKFMRENAAKVAEFNQARLAKITTDAKERIANEKTAKQVALQNKVKNNPNIKMPEPIRLPQNMRNRNRQIFNQALKRKKGGMIKKGHTDMRKGGMFY